MRRRYRWHPQSSSFKKGLGVAFGLWVGWLICCIAGGVFAVALARGCV